MRCRADLSAVSFRAALYNRPDLARTRDDRRIHHLPLHRENRPATGPERDQHSLGPCRLGLGWGQTGANDGQLRWMDSRHRPHPQIAAVRILPCKKIKVAKVGDRARKADGDQPAWRRCDGKLCCHQIERAAVRIDAHRRRIILRPQHQRHRLRHRRDLCQPLQPRRAFDQRDQ